MGHSNIETGNNSLPSLYYKPKTYNQLQSTWNRINSTQDKDSNTRDKLVQEFRSTIQTKLKNGGVYIHNEKDLQNFIVTYAGKEQRQFLALKSQYEQYMKGKLPGRAYKYEGKLTMDSTGTMKLTHGTAIRQSDTDLSFTFSSNPIQWKRQKEIEDVRAQGKVEGIQETEAKYQEKKGTVYGLTQAQLKKLQSQLRITADGIYGQKTRAAVRQLQFRLGVKQDGIAGQQTLKAWREKEQVMI